MPSIAALVITNFSAIFAAGKTVVEWVSSVRAAAQQRGEWTDSHEAEFNELVEAEAHSAAWKPDTK